MIRKMLENEHFLANIVRDTAENGLPKDTSLLLKHGQRRKHQTTAGYVKGTI